MLSRSLVRGSRTRSFPISHHLESVWESTTRRHVSRNIATASAAQEVEGEHHHSYDSHPIAPVHSFADVTSIDQKPNLSPRFQAVKNAKPFSDFLTDNYDRQHTYLRISITERCNLRCLYCMPEEGIDLSPPDHLLSTKEILHLAKLFVSQGVTKIRLTGGEPTVRKDIVELVAELGKLRSLGLTELAMTSNGISLARKLPKLVEGGLTGLNLSLDTLDEYKFLFMTRRKGLDKVLKTIDQALSLNVNPLKINCVVMNKMNDHEIPAFVELTKDQPIEVRFIEYMPFSGNKWSEGKMISFQSMLDTIRTSYPGLYKVQDHKNDTSKTYHIPGHKGKLGFITSMTHNFCGTCNRLRITSDGNLKVCLFGNAEVSLRDMMRLPGGMEAAAEKDLLKVIGKAVKKKEEKHAGLGELENMPNRPMILIDDLLNLGTTAKMNFKQAPKRPMAYPWLNTTTIYQSPSMHLRACFHSTPTPTPPQDTTTTTITAEAAKHIQTQLSHVQPTGEAHMVPIHNKDITTRSATATCTITFSNSLSLSLIRTNSHKKGDVLAIARIAGIMAAKKTSDIIPLCHNIPISHVRVRMKMIGDDRLCVMATVLCEGKTGVEMEALTTVMGASLTVYDMVKAVDKGMVISGTRVVEKKGGRSGDWKEDGWVEWQE